MDARKVFACHAGGTPAPAAVCCNRKKSHHAVAQRFTVESLPLRAKNRLLYFPSLMSLRTSSRRLARLGDCLMDSSTLSMELITVV